GRRAGGDHCRALLREQIEVDAAGGSRRRGRETRATGGRAECQATGAVDAQPEAIPDSRGLTQVRVQRAFRVDRAPKGTGDSRSVSTWEGRFLQTGATRNAIGNRATVHLRASR